LQGPDEPYYVLHFVIQERRDRAGVQFAQGIVFQHLGDGLSFGAVRNVNRTVCCATQVTGFVISSARVNSDRSPESYAPQISQIRKTDHAPILKEKPKFI
jgi:hypothetical protein